MSNIVLDRINNSTILRTKRVKFNEFVKPVINSNPISQDSLKNILIERINKQEQQNKIQVISSQNERVFVDLNDFVGFYELNREKFSDKQKQALETLVVANKMISVGCNCSRNSRYNRAQEYFKTFWENNKITDMPKKVAEILGVKKIQFQINNNIFLSLEF